MSSARRSKRHSKRPRNDNYIYYSGGAAAEAAAPPTQPAPALRSRKLTTARLHEALRGPTDDDEGNIPATDGPARGRQYNAAAVQQSFEATPPPQHRPTFTAPPPLRRAAPTRTAPPNDGMEHPDDFSDDGSFNDDDGADVFGAGDSSSSDEEDPRPPPPPQDGAASPTIASSNEGGILAAVQRLGQEIMVPEVMRQLFDWQTRAQREGSQSTVQDFKDGVAEHPSLLAFVFMSPGTAYLTVFHSLYKHLDPSGMGPMHGKYIGFIGDRSDTEFPAPFLLPAKKALDWTQANVVDNIAAWEEYASENANNLWEPDGTAGNVGTINLPRFLLLPQGMYPWLLTAPRTPWDLFTELRRLESGGGFTERDLFLAKTWATAAGQKAPSTSASNSILAIRLTHAHQPDPSFKEEWLTQLIGRIGERPQASPPAASAQARGQGGTAPTESTFVAQASSMFSKFEEFLNKATDNLTARAIATPQLTGGQSIGATAKSDQLGKVYTERDLFPLKAWCHVLDSDKLPYSYSVFQETKDVKAHRDEIMSMMAEWSKVNRIDIDTTVWYDDDTVKALVALNPNPGDGTAILSSAHKHLSCLSNTPMTSEERERVQSIDAARRATDGNRTFTEELAHTQEIATGSAKAKQTNLWKPPSTFEDLKLMVSTYAAQLCVLYGKECRHYKEVFAICMMLHDQEIRKWRENFTGLFCRKLVWAIIHDCRRYFSTRCTERMFLQDNPTQAFPRSMLMGVRPGIRDQNETYLVRPGFPPEWESAQWGRAKRGGRSGGTPGGAVQPMLQFQQQHQSYQQQLLGGFFGAPPPSMPQGAPPAFGAGPPQGDPTPFDPASVSHVHPTIRARLAAYYQTKGARIHLSRVLQAGQRTVTDLPPIPGQPNPCHLFILGVCGRGGRDCSFGRVHVDPALITDDIANAYSSVVGPCVDQFLTGGGGGGGRRHGAPAPAPAAAPAPATAPAAAPAPT